MWQGIEPFRYSGCITYDATRGWQKAATLLRRFMAALLLPCTDGNPVKAPRRKLKPKRGTRARALSSRRFLLRLAFETALVRRAPSPAQDQSPARNSSRSSAWLELEPTTPCETLLWCSALQRYHAVQSSRRGPPRDRDASAHLPGRTTTRHQWPWAPRPRILL